MTALGRPGGRGRRAWPARPARAGLALAALLGAACSGPGPAGPFAYRAPLLVAPERPFGPPPRARPERGDRVGEVAGRLQAVDRALRLAPREPALDVNSLDEVPDSGFFVNRVGARPVHPAEVARGGETGPPLAEDGPLRVVAAKESGVSGGFVVTDPTGARFLLKLDPPGLAGLLTGSEAVTTRLLWAVGYHVPDNRVARVDPRRLIVVEGGPSPERVAAILARGARDAQGRLVVLASRIVTGRRLGPMPWTGVDRRDPNDRIPHELRRELRGLRIFYAWVNNPDAKPNNSLDAWVPVRRRPGRRGHGAPCPERPAVGVVRHYLLDFGTSLGAGGSGAARAGWWLPLAWRQGHGPGTVVESYRHAAGRDVTRTIRRDRARDPLLAGLPVDVDPFAFRFLWTNPALARMDRHDAAWAARILLGLDDAHLRAAAAASGWPAPEQARLVERLRGRRDRIARVVLRGVSPLGRPWAAGGAVCAPDLLVARGLATTAGRSVLVEGGRARVAGARVCVTPVGADGYRIVSVRVRPSPRARPGAAVRWHLWKRGAAVRLLGVERGPG